MQAPVSFNLTEHLRHAIKRAEDIDFDALEGYLIEPLIEPMPPTTIALTPPASPAPANIDIGRLGVQHHPISTTRRSEPPKPSPTTGSIESKLRKARGHAKRSVQREAFRQSAPYGEYKVKPTALRHIVRLAKPIKTTLKTKKLPHTKNGYTGGRDKGVERRVFELHELVGEGSTHGFELKSWDGK